MKLRNRKTGEIIEFDAILPVKDVLGDSVAHLEYNSLAELNEEWEDLPEEPKEIYFISNNGQIHEEDGHDRYREARKEIGNYFDSRKEAEQAVEKLKAVKRLKDNGFRFISYDMPTDSVFNIQIRAICDKADYIDIMDELDLLFSQEGD